MADRYMKLIDFAGHIGKSRQYVSKLKQAGRLALTQDGRVKVKESLELIEQTEGNRSDVAERHAENRKAATPAAGEAEAQQLSTGMSKAEAMHLKAVSEARRVAALADKEEMERDRLAGNLVAREDVDAAMKFIGATVRALLDVFPDQTAPLVVAVNDMDECHALLTEACRNVLVGLGDAVARQREQMAASHD